MIKAKKDKILLLTSHYGEGHNQAANAIREVLWLENFHVDTVMIDPVSWIHPVFDSISRNFFVGGVKRLPSAYHLLYQKTRNQNYMSSILKGMNRIGIGRLLQLLNDIQPTKIVCTCPVTSSMISILKQYDLIDVPVVTVVTDYAVHSYWINPNVETYIVGSERVRKGLCEFGVNDASVTATGIPIHPKFSQGYDRAALRQKHGVEENIPTILISGGGHGLIGKDFSVSKMLQSIPFDIQLILVCGHNKRLSRQLKQEFRCSKHRVLVTGYIDYMDELMAISDMMITKAGGVSISEAMTMNLPLLLYQSIGGHEQDNMQFLLRNKAALLADDADDLYLKTAQMLTDRTLLATLQNNMRPLQRPHAAFDAVQVILEFLLATKPIHSLSL